MKEIGFWVQLVNISHFTKLEFPRFNAEGLDEWVYRAK